MTQSPDEMKELLVYLQNIKSYERSHIKSERSSIAMLWGLFIIAGGLLDGYISLFLDYSPHGPVWFIIIAIAMISQQIISSQPLLYEENFTDEIKRDSISVLEAIIIVIIMGLTYVVGLINPGYVMPYVGLAFGTVNLVGIVKARVVNFRNLIVVLSFYLSTIIGMSLIVIDPSFLKFSGLSFGLIVGLPTFYVGYLSRKDLVTA